MTRGVLVFARQLLEWAKSKEAAEAGLGLDQAELERFAKKIDALRAAEEAKAPARKAADDFRKVSAADLRERRGSVAMHLKFRPKHDDLLRANILRSNPLKGNL